MEFKQQFKIDGCSICEGCPPNIVADISANNENDLNQSK